MKKPPTAEVLFNQTSGRVHRVSARWAVNLRFSIRLRIALGHVALLLRRLPLAALLLILVYGAVQAPDLSHRQMLALETLGLAPDPDRLSLPELGVEGLMLDDLGGIAHGRTPDRLYWPGWTVWEGWGVTLDEESYRPYLLFQEEELALLFDLEPQLRTLAALLAYLVGLWLLFSIAILTRGQRISAMLLAPIADIAYTAQHMSEKNLSERINVAGTQNELRDLAIMVNEMLDRIESAYNRQKQFVSDASHELRTPIAVLQGYANLLARWGKDAPDVRDEAIAAILNETQAMKELVENLLFLARHDKKTLKLEMQPFSAAELVRETVKETELIARGHRVETGAMDDCTLNADRASIKQALRIFLDNAIKYTPEGGILYISCQVIGGECRIAIRDTGVGISKADLPRVFDRFYRADQARSGQAGGHGLGLSIARIIVSSHGGRIHVRSKLHHGSTFTIALPLKRHDGPAEG